MFYGYIPILYQYSLMNLSFFWRHDLFFYYDIAVVIDVLSDFIGYIIWNVFIIKFGKEILWIEVWKIILCCIWVFGLSGIEFSFDFLIEGGFGIFASLLPLGHSLRFFSLGIHAELFV